METIHVWCGDEVLVTYRGPDGVLQNGRYVARARVPPYAPLPQGEDVPAHLDVRRDVRRGHLTTTALAPDSGGPATDAPIATPDSPIHLGGEGPISTPAPAQE
jgi:hypothetical protein